MKAPCPALPNGCRNCSVAFSRRDRERRGGPERYLEMEIHAAGWAGDGAFRQAEGRRR